MKIIITITKFVFYLFFVIVEFALELFRDIAKSLKEAFQKK